MCKRDRVITQEQEMPQPPQEALDALEALIDSDFAEAEIEDRCNDDHFGIVAQGEWLGAATLCGVNLAFYGGGNGTPTWFYYHVDEENTSGYYKLVDSDWRYGHFTIWNYKDFENTAVNSGCNWRAYVYAWDASCGESGIWKRLAEEKF